MRLEVAISAAIFTLCLADVVSTNYVVTSGIGYESNEVLAPVLGLHIYVIKLAFMAATLAAIAKANMSIRLKLASYSTLLTFYTLVVVNNALVIFRNTDLNLNLGKLLIVFAAIFAANVVGSTLLKPEY